MRYFYNGHEIDRATALGIWLASGTYRNAAFKDAIWPNAESGSAKSDVINHLAEAGLRIEQSAPSSGEGTK